MPIKISVVIPTYRRPQLLLKCVRALVDQTFNQNDYEVLIVSDGWDKETEEAIRAISSTYPFIQWLHTEVKKGPAAARNLGWQKAMGVLIAFTDDDTIPDKSWLSGIWLSYKG